MCKIVNHLGICAAVRNYCVSKGLDPNKEIYNAGGRRWVEFMEELPTELVHNLREAGAIVSEYSRWRHGTGFVWSTLVSIPVEEYSE